MNQAAGENGPVLELKGLCKSFGGLHAVRDVGLKIFRGDRKAIIGPNGAGKTTLFNVVTGILPATSGHVLLFGKDVTGWPWNPPWPFCVVCLDLAGYDVT